MVKDAVAKGLTDRLLGIAEKQGVVAMIAIAGFVFMATTVNANLQKADQRMEIHSAATTEAIAQRSRENADITKLLQANLRTQTEVCKRLSKTIKEMDDCTSAGLLR